MAALTITAASVVKSATSNLDTSGIAGETITAGMPVYLKASDSKLWKALSGGTAAQADAIGIAMHAALAGQPLVIAKTGGTINIGATTAKTTTYMLGAAAGEVVPQADLASGNAIVRLGHATATDGTFIVDIKNTGATV